ncbi:MAG TPA: hypothetical protein VM784_04300 [Actinomycetota bacterium]|nr:hypothetical protein [Actinomycetota bacterium]
MPEYENVEAFREWMKDCLRRSSRRHLGRVFGFDTFNPEAEVDRSRRQMELLIDGEYEELEKWLAVSMGESEAHDVAIGLERQMREHNQSFEEVVELFRAMALNRRIPYRGLLDARDTLRRQLGRRFVIKPSMRKSAKTVREIITEALRDYPPDPPGSLPSWMERGRR